MNKRELFRRTFFTCAHVPVPVPLPPTRPPLALRGSVFPTDLLSSSVLNSQFFASICDLAQKLALE